MQGQGGQRTSYGRMVLSSLLYSTLPGRATALQPPAALELKHGLQDGLRQPEAHAPCVQWYGPVRGEDGGHGTWYACWESLCHLSRNEIGHLPEAAGRLRQLIRGPQAAELVSSYLGRSCCFWWKGGFRTARIAYLDVDYSQ